MIVPDWGNKAPTLSKQQLERIARFEKWEAKESEPYRTHYKYKKKIEKDKLEAALKTTKVPFTDMIVPAFLVENMAVSNLREQGYPQFWNDAKRIDELRQIIQSRPSRVQPLKDFYRECVEEIFHTHYVDWSMPPHAVMMGMMPPHFLSNVLWDLKKNRERKVEIHSEQVEADCEDR